MKTIVASVLALSLALPAIADTVIVDPSVVETRTVHETGHLIPLALSATGSPVVVLLDVAAGAVVPPHATESRLRLITVVSGTLYWGDGDTVDPASETAFASGSFLLRAAGQTHWIAARDGALRIQLVVLDDEVHVPTLTHMTR